MSKVSSTGEVMTPCQIVVKSLGGLVATKQIRSWKVSAASNVVGKFSAHIMPLSPSMFVDPTLPERLSGFIESVVNYVTADNLSAGG